MKQKLQNGLLILIGVGLLAYLFFGSFKDLSNTKDIHTIALREAAGALALEHSINGIIPTGTDYYYVGFDKEGNAYLIKAPKKWLEDNFDADCQALNPNGVTIKGLAKKISDFQVERELESRLSQLEGVPFPLGAFVYIDLNYMLKAILKLADGVLFLAVFLTGRRIVTSRDSLDAGFVKVWCVILEVASILALFVIR